MHGAGVCASNCIIDYRPAPCACRWSRAIRRTPQPITRRHRTRATGHVTRTTHGDTSRERGGVISLRSHASPDSRRYESEVGRNSFESTSVTCRLQWYLDRTPVATVVDNTGDKSTQKRRRQPTRLISYHGHLALWRHRFQAVTSSWRRTRAPSMSSIVLLIYQPPVKPPISYLYMCLYLTLTYLFRIFFVLHTVSLYRYLHHHYNGGPRRRISRGGSSFLLNRHTLKSVMGSILIIDLLLEKNKI